MADTAGNCRPACRLWHSGPAGLIAPDASAAAAMCVPLLAEHGRCVVKIHSRDIPHKSDIGGVRLDLTSAEAVHAGGIRKFWSGRAACVPMPASKA